MHFEYERPTTVEDALEILADRDRRGVPVAYGSDLLVSAKRGASKPRAVVDLTGIAEMGAVEERESALAVGAAVPLAELGRCRSASRFPALVTALGTMGSVQLREGASVGGNVCTASPAGDSGPPLLVYDATLVVAGPRGRREVAAADFYRGPGQCAVEPGEILVEVLLPWPPEGSVGTYMKGARRRAVDLALVSVAATAWPDATAASGTRLAMALGAVAPTPVRAAAAEALVADKGLEGAREGIADAAREAANPIDDIRATAEYRRELVGALALEAVRRLRSEMKGEVSR